MSNSIFQPTNQQIQLNFVHWSAVVHRWSSQFKKKVVHAHKPKHCMHRPNLSPLSTYWSAIWKTHTLLGLDEGHSKMIYVHAYKHTNPNLLYTDVSQPPINQSSWNFVQWSVLRPRWRPQFQAKVHAPKDISQNLRYTDFISTQSTNWLEIWYTYHL